MAGVAFATVAVPRTANAQAVVVEGRHGWYEDHSLHPLEIEPHFSFGADNVYGNSGFGGGPTVALGGRIHLGRNVSFTARLGCPTTTLVVSFM